MKLADRLYVVFLICLAGGYGYVVGRDHEKTYHQPVEPINRQMPVVWIGDDEFRPLTDQEYHEFIMRMKTDRVAREGWSEKQKSIPVGTCRICGNPAGKNNVHYCDGCYREASLRGVRSEEMDK